MRIYKVSASQALGSVFIGKQGENNATQIVFPISSWREKFGDGTFSLLHQRSEDSAPYPCAVTVDDENVYWNVTSADTQYAGEGKCELILTKDDATVKSVIFETVVYQSLGNEVEPPEPYRSWVNKVISAGTLAAESALTARAAEENVADMISSLDETPVLTESEISVEGDVVSQRQTVVNIKTGESDTRTSLIPLANGTDAGMMSPSDVAAIQEHTSKIAALEGQTVRLLYTASTSPTAAQIGAFVAAAGYTEDLQNVAVVVSGTFHIWHWYDNTEAWQDDGQDTVSQFTNSVAGIVRGAQIIGKIYAENDGTGSVYGWSDAMTRLSAAESAISAMPSFITLTQAQYDALDLPDEGTYYFILEDEE